VRNGLSVSEVDAIEQEVRRHTTDPIIEISFRRRRRSKVVNRAVVEVKILDHCNDRSAAGRFAYVHRTKKGWRLDSRSRGGWGWESLDTHAAVVD